MSEASPEVRTTSTVVALVALELVIDNTAYTVTSSSNNLMSELENSTLKDEYFIEKKLYPNVDFYSGIIFKAMGIPVSMFTVLFAVARNVGWIAQWNEMVEDPSQRIGRPRQLYLGETERTFVELKKRK